MKKMKKPNKKIICDRCREFFFYKQIHTNRKFVSCPYCGNVIISTKFDRDDLIKRG